MDFPSTIIVGNDTFEIEKSISQICLQIGNEFRSNNPDLYQIDDKTGWGIDEVRKLKSFASRKPFQYNSKLIIIFEAQNLGIESQNSILKLIEEPAPDTFIILTVRNPKNLLETIRSRCRLIKTKRKTTPKAELLIRQKNIAQNLLLSETLTQDKTAVIPYLENQISQYQQQLIQESSLTTKNELDKLIRTLKMVKANIDPKTALDWFLLS